MKKIFLMSFVLSILLASSIALAAVPKEMTLQGRLTDTNNNPYSGAYDFDIDIYDASSGGTSVFSQTLNDVSVSNGIFNIVLGNVNANFDKDYWVEITVESTTLSPRIKLTTSPYAFYVDPAGSFVKKSGDTMTGRLNLSLIHI